MMTEKKTLYNIFIEEASEIITMLENDLLELEADIDNKSLIDSVFRYIHTLKGSSGMVEYTLLTSFSHELENVLARVRSRELKITPGLISVFLNAVDLLKKFIVCSPSNAEEKIGLDVRASLENIRKFKGMKDDDTDFKPEKAGQSKESFEEKIIQISMNFRPDIYSTGTDPLMLLKELDETGKIIRIRCSTESVPELEKLEHDRLYLSWDLILKTEKPLSSIENIFIFVQDDNTIVLEDVTDKFVGDIDIRYADKMLGEILEEEGLVTEADLLSIIENQRKVGEILVQNKNLDTGIVDRVLESQKLSRELQTSSTIRVDTSKLDKLVNIVGELVISIARMNQLVSESMIKNRDVYDASEQLDRISRYVQEQVMKVRMVPIEGTFRKFQRIVRDTARDLNKRINLFMSGSDTELDKTLIEQIEAPLKHLIRNAVDHGVGTPEERISLGKPVEGSIWLRAYQQEGKIIIEVEDDGRGIDKKLVLKKATEKGLYKGGELSSKEIYNFLFLPGFSTAQHVTEISGRGVGLDVVRKNIESLRGSIDVFSEKGRGTLFRLNLPLTLAIIEGMQVSVGKEIITVPLFSIVEAVRPEENIVKTIEGKGELMEFRGGYIPLLRLYEIFEFETAVKDPANALILILEGHNRKIGLMVDDVTGQQQVVIKSLEKNYKQILGVSGATVLGGGKISLILDVYGLEKLAFGNNG